MGPAPPTRKWGGGEGARAPHAIGSNLLLSPYVMTEACTGAVLHPGPIEIPENPGTKCDLGVYGVCGAIFIVNIMKRVISQKAP